MKAVLAAVLAVVLVVAVGCGGGSADDENAQTCSFGPGWSTAPPVGGGAIQETAVVAVDGRIYVLGGFNASVQVVASVRVFDSRTCTWSLGPDLPAAVHHANAAVHAGTIYVLGAMQGPGFTPIGVVWSYNPATDTVWSTTRTGMPAGSERGSAVVGVIGDQIIVAGGLRGGAVATVSAYDVVNDTWDATLPALPAVRDHACGGVVGGSLYVLGGRTGSPDNPVATAYAYAPGGAWTTRMALPTARGGTACGVVGDSIIVIGGEGNAADPSGVFPQVERYVPATDAWTTLAPMPAPRHGMGAAVWDGAIYVPGGADQDQFAAVDTHEVLRP